MSDFNNESTDYAGPSGIARDSEWLTNEDIPHSKDTLVEIEAVKLYRQVKFQQGRTQENMLGLAFKGKRRRLLLNATNRKVLNSLFSTTTGKWSGHTIALYVQPGVRRPDGSTGPAVRIRDKLPSQPRIADER